MTEIVTISRPAVPARFRWLLPAVFAAGCGLAVSWPGHGGQLFGLGAIAGIWAAFLVPAGDTPLHWLLPTLAGGLPVVWFCGRLLDRQGTDLRLWALAAALASVVAGYWLVQGYADLEVAIDHHGSVLAYAVCALQLGSYSATLLALMFGNGGRVGR
jgi:hypothetical protein